MRFPLSRAAACFVAGVTLASAGAAQDAMAPRHRVWLEEEAVYIISETERQAFLNLGGEDLRDAFIEAFWQRRDPNPTSPGNEYREEHYERIAYANEFYGRDTGRAGWRTDRGRFHIVLGPPRTKEDFSYSNFLYPAELWFYNDPALRQRGVPPFFYLLFFRRFGAGEMQLYSPVEDGPQALLIAPEPFRQGDFRQAIEEAFDQLHEISPELASAALSFRTDEGTNFADVRAFGTVSLMDEIYRSPTYGIDTGYAERFDFGSVESDYLFNYVQSAGFHHVLPGPGGYYLHWAIELPQDSVFVVRDAEIGRYGAVFVGSIEISDADDPEIVLYEDRTESFFAVSEEEAGALGRPFRFRGVVPVIPGSHHLRVIVRNRACPSRDEAECRRAYTLLEGPIEVPELQFDAPELTVPVLAYGSDLRGGDPLYRGYRFGRRSLGPNPSGIFAAGTTLYLLSEPLNAPEDARVAWSVFPDPEALPQEEPPAPLEGSVAAHGDRDGPLLLSQPLGELPGGRYVAAVRLVDAAGAELARREVRLQVSPRAALARPLVDGGLGEFRPELGGAVELARARQWEAAGDGAMARAFAEEAVRVGPNFVPARELLARYRLEGDDPAGAETLLGPVFEAYPDRYDAARRLGEARVRTGDFEAALAPLTRALELRAPDADLLVLLATAHLVLGDEESAGRFLDEAYALDPENERVLALRRR
jgi:GWxTD domain-containing protein